MHRHSIYLLAAALASAMLLPIEPALAQFSTVIHVPPDVAPSSIGSGTQLNLGAGGLLRNNFTVNGGELNMTGGAVGSFFQSFEGSKITILGGNFGSSYLGSPSSPAQNNMDFYGGVVDLHGGTFGSRVYFYSPTQLTMWGGDFQLNGVPIAGLDNVGDSVLTTIPEEALFYRRAGRRDALSLHRIGKRRLFRIDHTKVRRVASSHARDDYRID
jgi:hypothetical protein